MASVKISLKEKTVRFLDKHLTGELFTYQDIIRITLPILVDQAFIVIMSMLNTAMISSAGMDAVSAVNMVDAINIFLIQVFVAVATGGTVIVAQYKGQGNTKMVAKTATQSIFVVGLISIILGILMIVFNESILGLLFGSAEPVVLQNAKLYLIGSSLSYPFIAIYQGVTGALRGVGDTKPVLGLSVLMNAMNTLLNVVFITLLQLSVTGLVLSVIIARLIGMIAALIYLVKFNESIKLVIKDLFQIDFSIQKKVMFIGIPFAAEQLFFNGGKLLTQTFIVQLGTLAIAANAIANSFVMLLQIGPVALSIAIVTVVGQCLGRRNVVDARKFITAFLGMGALIFIVSAALVLPLFPILIRLFNPEQEIIATIFTLVFICAVTQPFLWPHSFILPSSLRAAGDSTFTTMTSLLTMWSIRVVLGYVLGISFGFGIVGVWVAMVIEWSVRALIFTLRFRGEKWYRRELV